MSAAFTLKNNGKAAVCHATRRRNGASDPQSACSLGKVQLHNLERAQNVASTYLEQIGDGGKVKTEMVLDVLTAIGAAADWPKQNRPNVTHDAQPAPGICLGLVYAIGGKGAKASLVSEQFPTLAQFVVRWCRETLPGNDAGEQNAFPFSSLQINFNYAAKKHVDGNNIGPSYIQCIGDHTGGKLWTADQGVVDCKERWTLFDGNKEHATRPFKGTRLSFIAFTHSLYSKLKPDVQKTLLALGFNAARTDGQDLRFFERYRAEKTYLSDEHNRLFKRFLSERMASHPPPCHAGAVAVECYGRQADRGGGWISFVADGGRVQRIELKPNTPGVWCTVLSVRHPSSLALVEHVQFNFYKDLDGESVRFAEYINGLPCDRAVVLSIADTACAKSRPLGGRFYSTVKQLGGTDEAVGYRQAWAMIGFKGGSNNALAAHGERATLLRLQATLSLPGESASSAISMCETKTEKCSIGDAIVRQKA
jgi:hypothetical protein